MTDSTTRFVNYRDTRCPTGHHYEHPDLTCEEIGDREWDPITGYRSEPAMPGFSGILDLLAADSTRRPPMPNQPTAASTPTPGCCGDARCRGCAWECDNQDGIHDYQHDPAFGIAACLICGNESPNLGAGVTRVAKGVIGSRK